MLRNGSWNFQLAHVVMQRLKRAADKASHWQSIF